MCTLTVDYCGLFFITLQYMVGRAVAVFLWHPNLILSTSPTIIALCIHNFLPSLEAQTPQPCSSTEILLVSFSITAGRSWLPTLVVSMLEGAEGDALEQPVLRRLLQPELRDEMPKGHVQVCALWTTLNEPASWQSSEFRQCSLLERLCICSVGWNWFVLKMQSGDLQVSSRGFPVKRESYVTHFVPH